MMAHKLGWCLRPAFSSIFTITLVQQGSDKKDQAAISLWLKEVKQALTCSLWYYSTDKNEWNCNSVAIYKQTFTVTADVRQEERGGCCRTLTVGDGSCLQTSSSLCESDWRQAVIVSGRLPPGDLCSGFAIERGRAEVGAAGDQLAAANTSSQSLNASYF